MSVERSASTGEPYGVKRVCETLDVPRSSFYERKRRKRSKGRKAKKRGPRPAISDEKLLVLIRCDLASSPFIGEGYREPVAQGVMSEFGSVERGIARGIKLRMDHGTQYLSEHFQNQVKAWGMTPSFAFLEQPQTNGVAERFIRTLKEQAIYGRTFNTMEEARPAVAEFVELFNDQWLIEKNGYLSPRQAREVYYVREMEAAA